MLSLEYINKVFNLYIITIIISIESVLVCAETSQTPHVIQMQTVDILLD